MRITDGQRSNWFTQMTPADRQRKVELGELEKEGHHPFKVLIHHSNGVHGYSLQDVRNYYESSRKEFDIIVGVREVEENGAIQG